MISQDGKIPGLWVSLICLQKTQRQELGIGFLLKTQNGDSLFSLLLYESLRDSNTETTKKEVIGKIIH